MRLEGGRTVQLTADYLSRSTRDGSPAILHGYAATGHAAQGATLDSAFVLAGDAVYRECVALSRARNRTLVITPSCRASRALTRTCSAWPARSCAAKRKPWRSPTSASTTSANS